MKENYIKSLQVIREYDVKTEKEYNRLAKEQTLLCSESLKYISQTRTFKKIIKLAKKEVA
mgnify:FL=1